MGHFNSSDRITLEGFDRDPPPSNVKLLHRRIVMSARYGVELEVFEQTSPVYGWVVVARRPGGRNTQLPGVYVSRGYAEHQARGIAERWAQRFGTGSRRAPQLDGGFMGVGAGAVSSRAIAGA